MFVRNYTQNQYNYNMHSCIHPTWECTNNWVNQKKAQDINTGLPNGPYPHMIYPNGMTTYTIIKAQLMHCPSDIAA